MKVLIRKANIIAHTSPFHGTLQDILIENGTIASIEKEIKSRADKVIEGGNLHVSSGWTDIFANFCDPGEEFKETIETGCKAAAAGGFTQVMVIPNTHPVISSKGQVEYLIHKGSDLPVRVLPVGSVTKNAEGRELSEMYDMFESGAVAFSDGWAPLQSSGILQKSLEYLLAIDATLIQVPDDKTIGTHGLINEGALSTQLGLLGKPALSEELMVSRDIELARYTGAKLHLTGLSTAKSLELVANAKKEKVPVTCSVTPYHLYFCEEDLKDYDTNLKVNPPLRTKKDREALRKAVKSGLVDCIASHHQPQDWDHKVCEFEYARSGMETLEVVFAAAISSGIPAAQFVKMQTQHVHEIFHTEIPAISVGSPANLTLFDPTETFTFQARDIYSKSRNNAFVGKKLTGRVKGIIHGKRTHF